MRLCPSCGRASYGGNTCMVCGAQLDSASTRPNRQETAPDLAKLGSVTPDSKPADGSATRSRGGSPAHATDPFADPSAADRAPPTSSSSDLQGLSAAVRPPAQMDDDLDLSPLTAPDAAGVEGEFSIDLDDLPDALEPEPPGATGVEDLILGSEDEADFSIDADLLGEVAESLQSATTDDGNDETSVLVGDAVDEDLEAADSLEEVTDADIELSVAAALSERSATDPVADLDFDIVEVQVDQPDALNLKQRIDDDLAELPELPAFDTLPPGPLPARTGNELPTVVGVSEQPPALDVPSAAQQAFSREFGAAGPQLNETDIGSAIDADLRSLESLDDVDADLESLDDVDADLESLDDVDADLESLDDVDADLEILDDVDADLESLDDVDADLDSDLIEEAAAELDGDPGATPPVQLHPSRADPVAAREQPRVSSAMSALQRELDKVSRLDYPDAAIELVAIAAALEARGQLRDAVCVWRAAQLLEPSMEQAAEALVRLTS